MTVSPRVPTVLSGALTAALALGVLAACSSGDAGSGGSGGGTTAATSASPSPKPTDGHQLVQHASDALDDADAFHISGTIHSGDTDLQLDVTYGADGAAQGTVDAGDAGSVELRKTSDDTVYAKGDDAFYQQDSGSGTDYSTVVDKWVVVDDSAPDGLTSVASLLDRDDLVDSLAPDDDDADEQYTVSGPKAVDGTSAYVVTDEQGSTFAVAAEGDPLPVQITHAEDGDDDGEGELRFDGYGDDVDVQAPDDSEIVELPAS